MCVFVFVFACLWQSQVRAGKKMQQQKLFVCRQCVRVCVCIGGNCNDFCTHVEGDRETKWQTDRDGDIERETERERVRQSGACNTQNNFNYQPHIAESSKQLQQ